MNLRKSLRGACALLAFILCVGLLSRSEVKAQPKGLPPLIDRELFFGDPEIIGAQISPDGKFIAFIKPFKGTRNIWVKRTDEPFDKAKPVTADTTRPIPGYFWSRDGKYILFVQDKAGDENYLVYAVNPNDAPAAGQDVPVARNITDAKGVRAEIVGVPRTDPDTLYIGLNDRDKSWHDLYRVKISTGERTLVRQNTERIVGWTFDLKDQLRLATRINDAGETEILRVDDKGFTKVYSCNVFETCGALRYHKDGQRVYLETNKGGGIDLLQLELFDPASGKEEFVESDPMKRVDLGDATFSEVTDDLVATSYTDERNRVYFKDKAYEADYNLLKKQLPNKEIDFASGTKDERLWLIDVGSDIDPGECYLFNRDTKKLMLQYRIRENLNRDYLAPMKAIKYKSSDGLEIPAYLTLPKGVEAKNLPLIVFPHGGPWARDNWGYDTFAQFWANRGYAVLQPNFRGSTGYGKKFIDAGNKQWGDKMQDDITWGVKDLISQGIADGKKVGIMGGSYGGYATLAGVTFTPDLYAAAVDYVGPSNLITLLETIPPYWEAGRQIFYQRMGDPTTAEGKAQLNRQSPLNSANKIKTPLLVVQGANDPRVNKREADQIVDVSTLEKGTLLVTHRKAIQGPLTIELDFKDNKATGTMTMNGQSKPVSVDAGGKIFADGAGAFDVIARLPLTDGYATTFRNFDLAKQKVQLKQLKFLGAESVTVPAGTFDTYKIEVTSADDEADKQIVWIAKDSSKVVKISANLPSLGGAKLTSELTQ